MAKGNRPGKRTKKKADKKSCTTTVLQIFQPVDFICVEQLKPGDRFVKWIPDEKKEVYNLHFYTVRKVILPETDYSYYLKRFASINEIVFVVDENFTVLMCEPFEKVGLIHD